MTGEQQQDIQQHTMSLLIIMRFAEEFEWDLE